MRRTPSMGRLLRYGLLGVAVLASSACGSSTSGSRRVASTIGEQVDVTNAVTDLTVEPVLEPAPQVVASTNAPRSTGSPTTPPPASATSVSAPTNAPLTGLPVDADLRRRPALIVKIDGHEGARPQYGLEQADIVIEEIVEGITRFMAVFHSVVPEVVGPVRSARTQDMLIAPMFDHPLFAWSGGNRKVTALVKKSPVVNLSATSGWRNKGVWSRTKKRKAPHNLLATGPLLLALAPPDSVAPPSIFGYRSPDGDPGGRVVSGVKLVMSATRVLWTWNSKTASWLRTSDRKPHLAEGDLPVSPANVVVLEVRYRPSEADPNSPEAQTIGTGRALVFTDGRLVVGTWSRDSDTEPWTLTDSNGREILLTPGRTWVELARASRLAIVDVGVDPASVPWKIK